MPNALPADPFAGMTRIEKGFALQREHDKRVGLIREWWYEKITLKLADDTRYTPDFVIVHLDGMLECVETKGFMRDDAHVKVKVAAAQFPFRFTLVDKKGVHDYTHARRI